MPRPKKELSEFPTASKPEDARICQSCKLNGKKTMMTARGKDTLTCPVCHAWAKNPEFVETKEEKIAKLKAELAKLEG